MTYDELMERLQGCIREGMTEENRREVWLDHAKVRAVIDCYVAEKMETGDDDERAIALANTIKHFNAKWAQKGEYIAQLEKEREALRDKISEAEQRAVSAEFWRAHAIATNTEFEADYLRIWRAVKQPHLSVLDSVLQMKQQLEQALMIAQMKAVVRADDNYQAKLSTDEQEYATRQ